jgi:diguanylate cyclase (GGDEF)-like protein/PAS domain S-box-containing protein
VARAASRIPPRMRRLELLDGPPQESFDRLTRLLSRLLSVPVSLLSLIDDDRHFLLSHVGLGEPWASLREVPLAHALGERLATARGGPIVVTDARQQEGLGGDPAIASSGLIACVGMPLVLGEERVGALWAADETQREWSEADLAGLADVAALVVAELEHRGAEADREAAEAALYDTEERVRLAFDAASVGMMAVSLDPAAGGCILRANKACCEFLGRGEADLIGVPVAELTHPDDLELTEASFAALTTGTVPIVRGLEKRYLHSSGHFVWAALTSTAIPAGGGAGPYAIALIEDITERKQAERDLPAIANVLRRILSGADARQAIVQAAVDIAGASSAHLLERAGAEKLTVTASARLNLVGVDVQLDAPSATAEAYLRGEPTFLADPADDPLVSRELLELSRARSIMWQPIFSHEGVIGVLCVCWAERVDDVSARAARAVALLTVETAVALAHHDALERLAAQATTDPLTELPNRRAWDECLRRGLAAAARHERPITLALLDMDRFKRYNDTHGHAAGDELLREFATRARRLLRDGDTLARWGGEEFAILLPDCPPGSFVESTLDRVRAAVPGGQSCSIGYAAWDRLESAEQLVRRADRALYRAKATGRDRTISADPTPGGRPG